MGNNARKYVDLIHKASGGKHANWDPPKLVEVGDWGHIDKKTAAFVKEGNIFTDPQCSDALGYLDKPILYTSPEDIIRFSENAVSNGAGHLSSQLGVTGDVGIKFETEWAFSPKNRGAILTASDVTMAYLEPGIVFPRLGDIAKLKDKAIVVEAYTCPAYALLLSDKGRGGSASLCLEANISGAGVTLGPGIGGRWRYQSETGVWRTAYGYRTDEKTLQDMVFTPLFALRTLKRRMWPRYRGASPLANQYEGYGLPWKTLDEDGEEDTDDETTDDVVNGPLSSQY